MLFLYSNHSAQYRIPKSSQKCTEDWRSIFFLILGWQRKPTNLSFGGPYLDGYCFTLP